MAARENGFRAPQPPYLVVATEQVVALEDAGGAGGKIEEKTHSFEEPRPVERKNPSCAYRELHSSVAMMQPTDHRLGSEATKPFDWSAYRRILG
jgi:hypothetical protein